MVEVSRDESQRVREQLERHCHGLCMGMYLCVSEKKETEEYISNRFPLP